LVLWSWFEERAGVERVKTKQQVISEFRRGEIIKAARTVFARRGFAGGILDEIAMEAGIAKGTVYLYFRSKAEIYMAVLDHDMNSLRTSTLERIDAASGVRDKIRAFTLARLENAEAKKEFFSILNSDEGQVSLSFSRYRDWLREPVERLAAVIEDASRRGEIRAVPAEKTAWMITDMTRGTIQRRLSANDCTPACEEAEFLSSFIWAGLAIEAERV
jgi:TetR/AcrR family fatty acid metabolism transcriptional regulator